MGKPIFQDEDVRRGFAYLLVSVGIWGVKAIYDSIKERQAERD